MQNGALTLREQYFWGTLKHLKTRKQLKSRGHIVSCVRTQKRPVHALARDTAPTTDLSLPTLEIGNYLNCLKFRLQKQKLLWVLYYWWDFYWKIQKKIRNSSLSCGYNYNSFLDSDLSSDRKDSYFLTKYFFFYL